MFKSVFYFKIYVLHEIACCCPFPRRIPCVSSLLHWSSDWFLASRILEKELPDCLFQECLKSVQHWNKPNFEISWHMVESTVSMLSYKDHQRSKNDMEVSSCNCYKELEVFKSTPIWCSRCLLSCITVVVFKIDLNWPEHADCLGSLLLNAVWRGADEHAACISHQPTKSIQKLSQLPRTLDKF